MSAAKKKKSTKKKSNNNTKNKKVVQKKTENKEAKKVELQETKNIENEEKNENENLVITDTNKDKEKIKNEEVKIKKKTSKKKEEDKKEEIVDSKEPQKEESEIIEKKETKKIKKEPKEKEEKENKEQKNEKIEPENKETSIVKKEGSGDDKSDNDKKNNKRMIIIIVCIILLAILIISFSTLFALFNANNTNIITGVKVKKIDISDLSIEDSKLKLQECLEKELIEDVVLKYNDYEVTLSPSQIEFNYEIDEVVEKSYKIGRDGNLIKNNYTILLITLFGKNQEINYSYNEDFLNEFIDDVSSKIPGVVVNPSYYIEESNLIINQGLDGISVIKNELKEKIIDAILKRNYETIEEKANNIPIEIPVEDAKAEKIDIEKIYNEVRRDPKDAYFETEPYQIYPDQDGIDFNLEEAKEIVKEEKEEYSIPLTITKAEKTIKDLGFEAFPNLLSEFSTRYIASNVNRTINLQIAANKINGLVLMPGEEFSFNKVVGKRTVEAGYKDAAIYQDGGVVDGLAGGICQISSTLYNAVLLSNLEIVERRNHSFVTSYLPAGRDATVVYGAIDFRFKNSRNYPIKIEASVSGGVTKFRIHGLTEENEYDIQIQPVITASIPYSTQYVENPGLAPGEQIVTQGGQAGYKVTTYLQKTLNGEVVSREIISNDTYSPMRAIVNIGPIPVVQ